MMFIRAASMRLPEIGSVGVDAASTGTVGNAKCIEVNKFHVNVVDGTHGKV